MKKHILLWKIQSPFSFLFYEKPKKYNSINLCKCHEDSLWVNFMPHFSSHSQYSFKNLDSYTDLGWWITFPLKWNKASEYKVACVSGQEEKIMSLFKCLKVKWISLILLDLDLARLRSLDLTGLESHDLDLDSVALISSWSAQDSKSWWAHDLDQDSVALMSSWSAKDSKSWWAHDLD